MKGARWLVVLFVSVVAVAGCVSSPEKEAERAKRQKFLDTQVQLGAAYLQSGQYAIAKEHLDRALEMDSDHPAANNIMGVLQWRGVRDYDAAERYFKNAIENDKKNAAAYHNYGAFLCDRRRLDEGVHMLERAIAQPLYAQAAEANLNAAACLMMKPAPKAAEPYLREALRLRPELPQALIQMAHLSYDSGRALAARGYLQRYHQVALDTADSLYLAVRVETALKDKNAAASFALRLRSKFPASEEAQKLARESASKRAAPTRKKK